jgi:hypothetical protein
MIRLLLPSAGVVLFFLSSLATVRMLRPREPRRYFLIYGLLLLAAEAVVYVRWWPPTRPDDLLGLAACLLLQAVACLTMWNTFYSLLWGFSGGLCHDLYQDAGLRTMERIVRSYSGDGDIDRMMARRLPNLVRGEYVVVLDGRLSLQPKGRLIARGTRLAFKVFSLGMGGGVK